MAESFRWSQLPPALAVTVATEIIVRLEDGTFARADVSLVGDLLGGSFEPAGAVAAEQAARTAADAQLQALLDTKLDAADYAQYYVGTYVSLAALQAAHPAGSDGQYALVDAGAGASPRQYVWDVQAADWVAGSDAAPGTTDALAEGGTNLYFTAQRVRDVVLTGLSLAVKAAITAADPFIVAAGKIQAQINDILTRVGALEAGGGGGGGKPKAAANQVVNVAAGTKTVAQAFADLDAYDYAGTGYTGTIQIPAGYEFTTADTLVLSGRRDCGWLNILSAQFPTPHAVTSAPPAANVFGYFSALFAFVQSTYGAWQVSIDASGLPDAFYTFYAELSDMVMVGDAVTNAQAIFKASTAGAFGAYVQECSAYYLMMDADIASIANNRLGVANVRAANTGATGFTFVGNNSAGYMHIQVGDNTYLNAYGNTPSLNLNLEGGELHCNLQIGGKVLIAPVDVDVHLRTYNGSSNVIVPVDSANISFINLGINWRPGTVAETLFHIYSAYAGGNLITIDATRVPLDTSLATPIYAFGMLQYATNVNLTVLYDASWGNASTGITDIAPNVMTANGTIFNDPAA